MIYYTLGSFSIVIFNIILWALILSNRKKDVVVWSYVLWSAVVSGWALGYGITLSGWFGKPVTLFWNRFCHANASFIGIFFLQLAYALTHQLKKKKNYMRILYLIGFSLLILVFTPLFVKDLWQMAFFKYQPLGGPLYVYFTLVFFFTITQALWVLYRRMISVEGKEKEQLKIFLIGTIIGYTGGANLFIQAHHLNILPIGVFFISPYVLFTGYAIYKYGFLNIEVLLKKTLIFASLFATVLGTFIGITLLTQELIIGGRLLGLAISSVVIILGVQPLEDFLIKITDKYLFQKKYDYKQILKSFIDEVITELNLDEIIKSTSDLLSKTLHPENSAILLHNRYEDKYVSYKISNSEKDISLNNNSKVVTLAKTTKDIFCIEKPGKFTQPTFALKKEMEELGARVAIPLMLHNDLIGLMLLGKKKSDEEYSKEDLDILNDLARTEAIAIGNAQLFAETAQNERRAAIGTLAAGINHEVGNPLNIINTKMQVYLMSLNRGMYKDRKPEDIIEESKEIMNTCLQQTARISDITRKLSNFARPSKEFKPEATDIEEQIDETLSVIGHELELERIEIKKDIEKSLPKILSDKRQIQQIFFNIIKNSAQAIKEKGKIEIKVYTEKDNNEKNIKINVSDTGHGIPEDKLEKIYDPFFTTKEPGKGTGLGLSIVRQLVWRNKGDIQVKSKVGAGTTFVLTFPEAR